MPPSPYDPAMLRRAQKDLQGRAVLDNPYIEPPRRLPQDAADEIARLSAAVDRQRDRNDELRDELEDAHRTIANQRKYIEAAERSADRAMEERDKMRKELTAALASFEFLRRAWSDAP